MIFRMQRQLAGLLAAVMICSFALSGVSMQVYAAKTAKKEESAKTASKGIESIESNTDSKIEDILSGMTIEEKIGQMIIPCFRTWKEDPVTELPEELKKAIARDHFGGIILFSENCRDSEQTQQLVSSMQLANLESDSQTIIPLMIAADQEGGAVSRLGEGTRGIGNMAIAATGDPENARTAAKIIGEELAEVGINTDFAPDLDVNSNPANPVIGIRSFSDDPEMVVSFGIPFLEGLKETGTICSIKHFPGHGDVATDSHTGFPIQNKTYEELKKCELIPFQAAINDGVDMVMTAHIQYPGIEKQTYTSITTGEKVYLPATLSKTILTGILREDLGFDGVIVSDALEMAAIKDNFDLRDIPVLAIEAGIDMFLMPIPVTDNDSLLQLENLMAYICGQVKNGTISESRIDDSVRRILRMKENHGILDVKAGNEDETTGEKTGNTGETVGEKAGNKGESAGEYTEAPADHHTAEWEMMQKAAALLKNEDDLIPVQLTGKEKILFLYSTESRIASGEYAALRLKKEGLIPGKTESTSMVYNTETEKECIEAALKADLLIAVSTTFGLDSLNPLAEGGKNSAVLDRIMEAAHEHDKKFIFVSSYLPYDVARFQQADAIIATFGSAPMKTLPGKNEAFAVNIPAAVCGIFGEFEFTGSLPVDIPAFDKDYVLSDEILYPRGFSLQ